MSLTKEQMFDGNKINPYIDYIHGQEEDYEDDETKKNAKWYSL